MNATSMMNSAKRLFTPAVLVAAVAVPAFADYTDDVANAPQQGIQQPPGRGRPYVLPPLSDHIIVAMADEDAGALNDDGGARDGESANSGTAKQYEPEQGAIVILIPSDLEAIDQESVSDDETAQQSDTEYQDEDTEEALVIIVDDDDDED